jgi:hypothetical protein
MNRVFEVSTNKNSELRTQTHERGLGASLKTKHKSASKVQRGCGHEHSLLGELKKEPAMHFK